LRTLKDWKEFDPFFVETPLQVDDLLGYARLHHEAPMRIAAGEWQNTRHEFADLMDVGLVDVAQPVPTKPGLGIELNQAAVEKFRVD